MNPQHLAYLTEIVETGSLAKAAEKLNLTQPTLSRIVKQLEEKAASPLFKRGRYGMTPTALCERLAKQGLAIKQSSKAAVEAISHWKMGLEGEIRLGVGPMLTVSIMADFFKLMLDEDWSMALHVETGPAARLIESLSKGKIDAAVVPSKLTLKQDELVQVPLFKDELAIFCAADHPLLKGQLPLSKRDLKSVRWVETGSASGLFHNSPEVLAEMGLDYIAPKLKFSGDLLMAAHVVAQGDMLCMLPKLLVSKFNFPNNIVELPVNFDLPSRNIAFWTRRKNAEAAEIMFLQQKLSGHVKNLGFD